MADTGHTPGPTTTDETLLADHSPAYQPGWLEQQLAADERVGELDLHVELAGERVVVTGFVASAERREAVVTVLTELVSDREISNHVTVMQFAATDEVEELP